ncbi:hypothetical protein LTR44_001845 [Exophiala sp. CCFEE 6388]|nr:hypothetical protein LTR44_001845 [Eurotiomycetes sp. CCFEE 6388]
MHQYRPLLRTDLEDPSELELDVLDNGRGRDEGHQLIERGLSILAHQSRKASSFLITVKTRHMLALLPQFLQPDGLRLTKTLHPTSYLDALRGYAAWVVLNFHLRNPETWLLQQFPLRVFHRGRAMVDIFFIISGYVLSLKTLRLMRQQNDSALLACLASSTFRRYLRLYLSCIAATLISMVLVHLGVIGFWFNQRQDTLLAELSHWTVNTLLVFANPLVGLRMPE